MRSFASLTQLTVFVRIAESGSLSAAARALSLTPSAVSKSLAQLEERLGVLLIKRTTRNLTLTESGRAILEKANDLLTDLEATFDTARSIQGRVEGRLRVTCSLAFGCSQLTPWIARYIDGNPHVEVDVALDDHCVNLAEGSYDIALRITAGTDWGYAARKLSVIRWVYCASPEYISRHDAVSTPEDLSNHQCLVYPDMTPRGAWTFRRDKEIHQVTVKPKLTANSSLALREAALLGHGVACLPTYLVSSDILRRQLVQVVPEYRSAIEHVLYAMYYKSKYANYLVRDFIDFIAECYGDLPPWDLALQSTS
ncbi:LysR family transcriptional regulator [Cupriavidus sp. a3]|uniref:LysR family transcriptional regulator n=1 Tax=Cupriavidus sp. a3 TaxID=3242158 RepID=UPI003D9C515A